jgi:hypothetical protein
MQRIRGHERRLEYAIPTLNGCQPTVNSLLPRLSAGLLAQWRIGVSVEKRSFLFTH